MGEGTRAVVVGGSIAGMCAAQVLSRTFDHVTLVERDEIGEAPHPRRGVPQARHVHALLVRGRREIEGIFPGFEAAALRMGASELDFGTAFLTMRPLGWEPRAASGMLTLWGSRDLLEAAIRERMRALGSVEVIGNASATKLIVKDDRVRGVTIAQENTPDRTLEADLVVDAAGRASRAKEWLKDAGHEPPDETLVDSFAGYSSLWIRAPKPEVRARWGGWKGMWIDIKPPEIKRACVLFPIEDDRCIVTLAGINRDYPPSDEAGFRAALEALRSPIVAEATRDCEAISPVFTSRSMANRMRHYDRWRAPLDGFLAIGDSVCAFNPVYGQGMSTSAACAGILRKTLDEHGTDVRGLARAFFRAQAKFLAQPWAMATGADFMFPETQGERSKLGHLLNPYMLMLFVAALEDDFVRLQMGEVFNLIRPMTALFSPAVAARAIAKGGRRLLLDRVSPRGVPRSPPG